MARYSFDSIAEVMAFVSCLTAKAKKEGKGGDEPEAGTGSAPPPVMPPAGGPQMSTGGVGAASGFPGGTGGFPTGAPPAGGAATPGAFPATAAPAIAPEVAAWVQKISGVIDAQMAGPKAAEMLTWFRGLFGTEAAQATPEQIKTVFLPRASIPQLTEWGRLMGLS